MTKIHDYRLYKHKIDIHIQTALWKIDQIIIKYWHITQLNPTLLFNLKDTKTSNKTVKIRIHTHTIIIKDIYVMNKYLIILVSRIS